jgi:hypothetical protein
MKDTTLLLVSQSVPGPSQLSSLINTMETKDNINYIIFFLTEGYLESDNPSYYVNFMDTDSIPSVVFAIEDVELSKVENLWLPWTARSNTFFSFSSLDELNSETVLTSFFSDEVDLGDLYTRMD